jgi:hypothetical protein
MPGAILFPAGVSVVVFRNAEKTLANFAALEFAVGCSPEIQNVFRRLKPLAILRASHAVVCFR